MKFKWDPVLYDANHDFVSKYGMELIGLLNPQKDECILDLGCGTGDLTKLISGYCREVSGLDNSSDMIMQAVNKYPGINFIEADIKDFSISRQFDAIFSNAVLHWITQAETAIQNINRHLKRGGRFVAEFGGSGCVSTIISELTLLLSQKNINYQPIDQMLYYPKISEYSAILERNGFEVNYAVLFDRPTELKDGYDGLNNFVEMFFSWLFSKTTKEIKNEILNLLNNNLKEKMFVNNSWVADYRRIRIVAFKTDKSKSS